MRTNDDHFHTRFLLIQRVWFGALSLYLIMTLAATGWERIAKTSGDQEWTVPALLTVTAGVPLRSLARRRIRSIRASRYTRA